MPTNETPRGNGALDDQQGGRVKVDPTEARRDAWLFADPIIRRARSYGRLPRPGGPEWSEAQPIQRLAALLVLAEAWLAVTPEERFVEAMKAAAVSISTARDWTKVGPSFAELQRRRGVAS